MHLMNMETFSHYSEVHHLHSTLTVRHFINTQVKVTFRIFLDFSSFFHKRSKLLLPIPGKTGRSMTNLQNKCDLDGIIMQFDTGHTQN